MQIGFKVSITAIKKKSGSRTEQMYAVKPQNSEQQKTLNTGRLLKKKHSS